MKNLVEIKNPVQCRELWQVYGVGQGGLGVTANYDFRQFYANLFSRRRGSSTRFVCNDLIKPDVIIPLSDNSGGTEWFGTHELEDPSLFCPSELSLPVLQLISQLRLPVSISSATNLSSAALNLVFPKSEWTAQGVKVVIRPDSQLDGHEHWSRKNLKRARHAFEALHAEWNFIENPSAEQIEPVFDESVHMFDRRGRTSKFYQAPTRREKYTRIYTARIPDVLPVMGICTVRGDTAIKTLMLICNGVVTVSTVTVNVDHSEKCVAQHGFRYAIQSLPAELERIFNCQTVDYQGGDHSWKKEVHPSSQITQYKVDLIKNELI